MPNVKSRNPLTLSRQELYELVWSKPVTEVAKEIGLSDVAVAKRCRQVQVPVPPRGYWARVTAGQTPRRIPLPKYRDSADRRGRAKKSSILSTPPGDDAQPESHEAGVERSGVRAHADPTVTFYGKERDELAVPVAQSPHRVALDAKLSQLSIPADAPENWLNRDDRTLSPPGWSENPRTGARLPFIAVHSQPAMVRARRILTQLIHVITQLGWRFNPKAPDPEPTFYRRRYETREDTAGRSAHFLIEEERLFVSLTERQTRTERPLTAAEQRERRRNPTGYFYYADRYSYHPSGELTLHVSRSDGRGSGFASFRDSKRKPLEVKISDVVRCLLDEALAIKERRQSAAEAAERQRREDERRERIRKTREAHAYLIATLEAQVGAWERAQRLRRYLRAARRVLAPGERIEAMLEGAPVDLLALGEAFADQLGPLHPSRRTGMYFDETDPYANGVRYESDEAKIRTFMMRAMGGDWRHASKTMASEPSPEGTSDEDAFPESLLEDS
jgi:hypothetical protein